jgi:hypothetical protein
MTSLKGDAHKRTMEDVVLEQDGDRVTRNGEMADILGGYEAQRYIDLAVGAAAYRFDPSNWAKLSRQTKNEIMCFVIGVARDAFHQGEMQGIEKMADGLRKLREEANSGC